MQNLFNAIVRFSYKLSYRLIRALWFFTRPTINGVFVAVWHRGDILIIRNSYRKWFLFPCGRIKRRETLAEAAVRELAEEVGIEAEMSQLAFSGTFAARYKYALDNGHFFEIELRRPPALRIDQREVVWAAFMAPEEALALTLNPLVRMYLEKKGRRPVASPAAA